MARMLGKAHKDHSQPGCRYGCCDPSRSGTRQEQRQAQRARESQEILQLGKEELPGPYEDLYAKGSLNRAALLSEGVTLPYRTETSRSSVSDDTGS